MEFSHLVNRECDTLIKEILKNPLNKIPSLEEAIDISRKYSIALHPRYLLYWNELSSSEFVNFLEFVKKTIKLKFENKELKFSYFPSTQKRTFEILGVEHFLKTVTLDKAKSEKDVTIIILNLQKTKILLANLGYFSEIEAQKIEEHLEKLISFAKENLELSTLKIINSQSKIEIRDKAGTYIGARMGRPEKAKMRKLDGKPHGLFPIGHGQRVMRERKFGDTQAKEEVKQNRLRNIIEAIHAGTVEGDFCMFECQECGEQSLHSVCVHCKSSNTTYNFYHRYDGTRVKKDHELAVRFKKGLIDLEPYTKELRNILESVELPKLVKGIKGMTNKHKVVEHLVKAFLREKNGVFVNKDGTIRYDMIEMGVTHFKPLEIGTSLDKLKELGYTHDYKGNPLERDDQLLEIFPQDVILPDCTQSGDELASDYVMKTGSFVDELLTKLYKLDPFYNFKTKEDTVGHLVIGLAPHTSAGIIGRIIGYTKTQGCFSHPVWHAAQRRNLDGDENGVMLLLDGLINFSRQFLPDTRGARTMDTSLVLTSHLYLDQIDDEVHGMDIVDHYPLEFYRAAKEFTSPKEIKLEKVEDRINVEEIDQRYLNYYFTHSNGDINNSVLCSSYKSIPSMKEKLDLQLGLGKKIRAVDENKVGSLIIDRHFMKDIKGNLRKFSMQNFRCTKCNTIYRRPPLVGKCIECGEPSINFTISEGSIKKYLHPSFKITQEYEVDPYIMEVLELTNLRIEGVFGKEAEKQKNLQSFFK